MVAGASDTDATLRGSSTCTQQPRGASKTAAALHSGYVALYPGGGGGEHVQAKGSFSAAGKAALASQCNRTESQAGKGP
jgi:hypothetical protein